MGIDNIPKPAKRYLKRKKGNEELLKKTAMNPTTSTPLHLFSFTSYHHK
jgi:hypothetical protein